MTIRRSITILVGIFIIVAVLAATFVLGYRLMLQHSAERLVRSAGDIRSTADVHRITDMWRREYGNHFTERGPDGNRTYDVVLTNESLHRLHLVPFTYLLASIMTKNGQLSAVTVSMYVEPRDKIQRLILIVEDFSQVAALFRVEPLPDSQTSTIRRAKVYLSGGVSESQRLDAFNVNTSCLVRFSGCQTQQMLPTVKEISSPSS